MQLKTKQNPKNLLAVQVALTLEVRCGEEVVPTKPRSRSVPDVAVLNSLFRFLRNRSLSTNVFQGASFGIGAYLKLLYRYT